MDDSWTTLGLLLNACGWLFIKISTKDCLLIDILSIFHPLLLLGTSIFAIPSMVFEGFAMFAKSLPKRFPSASEPPKVLQHDSKTTPRAYQDAPKTVPRASMTDPKAPKIVPRDPKRSLWATLGLLLSARGWLFIKFSTKRLPLDRYLAHFSSIPAPQNLHFCNTFQCF